MWPQVPYRVCPIPRLEPHQDIPVQTLSMPGTNSQLSTRIVFSVKTHSFTHCKVTHCKVTHRKVGSGWDLSLEKAVEGLWRNVEMREKRCAPNVAPHTNCGPKYQMWSQTPNVAPSTRPGVSNTPPKNTPKHPGTIQRPSSGAATALLSALRPLLAACLRQPLATGPPQ